VEPDDGAALQSAIMEAALGADERLRRGQLARTDVLARYTWQAATEQLGTVLAAAMLERDGYGKRVPGTAPLV
jgi:hypothetical protein